METGNNINYLLLLEMVKIRIIPKYVQFEFENDLEKSNSEILSISPNSQVEIRMESKNISQREIPKVKLRYIKLH
jgi:hypothetical protein